MKKRQTYKIIGTNLDGGNITTVVGYLQFENAIKNFGELIALKKVAKIDTNKTYSITKNFI